MFSATVDQLVCHLVVRSRIVVIFVCLFLLVSTELYVLSVALFGYLQDEGQQVFSVWLDNTVTANAALRSRKG